MAGNLGKENSSSVQDLQDPSITGGSKMAGNLGKEDSSSVQDLQDPSITAAHAYTFEHAGSGHKRPRGSVQRAGNKSAAETSKECHKRPRGSVQPSSSRAGKKSPAETSKESRERKKAEDEKLKAEIEKLKASNFHLEGQTFQLRMDQKDTKEEVKKISEENFNLRIVQKSQSGSILELGKVELIASGEKINALKEEHAQEIHALKEEHAQEIHALREELERQMRMCTSRHIDVGNLHIENAGEMNNPMETPATAQATTYFNFDTFASQMEMASLGKTYVAGVNI